MIKLNQKISGTGPFCWVVVLSFSVLSCGEHKPSSPSPAISQESPEQIRSDSEIEPIAPVPEVVNQLSEGDEAVRGMPSSSHSPILRRRNAEIARVNRRVLFSRSGTPTELSVLEATTFGGLVTEQISEFVQVARVPFGVLTSELGREYSAATRHVNQLDRVERLLESPHYEVVGMEDGVLHVLEAVRLPTGSGFQFFQSTYRRPRDPAPATPYSHSDEEINGDEVRSEASTVLLEEYRGEEDRVDDDQDPAADFGPDLTDSTDSVL